MDAKKPLKPLVLGQRVGSHMHAGKAGYVVNIIGEQKPETIGSMGGGVCSYGGSADFLVIWEDGSPSRIPESIVHGIGWTVHDEVLDADGIAALQAKSAEFLADKEKVAQARKTELAAKRAEHRAKNTHLLATNDPKAKGEARTVAENIRREVKRLWPTASISVVKDGYDSVRCTWTNGPSELEFMEKVGKRHQSGYFDGMTDSFVHVDNPFGDVFGSVRFVMHHRSPTIDGIRDAWRRAGNDPNEVPDNFLSDMPSRFPNGEAIRRAWYETTLTPEVPPANPKRPGEGAPGLDYVIEEHTHTKHGFQMFIIVLSDRVSKEKFDELRGLAQERGGWYSRKWGRTPNGFAFKLKAVAEAFALEFVGGVAPQVAAVV